MSTSVEQTERTQTPKKRQIYELKFKMEAIEYALETSNREAAVKFKVDKSLISRWRKNHEKIK